MKWFHYFRRGLAVVGILSVELPKAMKDGKLTVQEITDIFLQVCAVCDWDIAINVPPEIVNTVVAIAPSAPTQLPELPPKK